MFLALQNLHFLDQAIELLESLDDSHYTSRDCHGHSSTGAHMRHVLDGYRCFLSGLEDGRVDYDARLRESTIEVDRAAALERVRDVRRHLAEPQSQSRRRGLGRGRRLDRFDPRPRAPFPAQPYRAPLRAGRHDSAQPGGRAGGGLWRSAVDFGASKREGR